MPPSNAPRWRKWGPYTSPIANSVWVCVHTHMHMAMGGKEGVWYLKSHEGIIHFLPAQAIAYICHQMLGYWAYWGWGWGWGWDGNVAPYPSTHIVIQWGFAGSGWGHGDLALNAPKQRERGNYCIRASPHPSNIKPRPPIGLLPIHLKWSRVHYFGVFKANSGVKLASRSSLGVAHYTKVVYVVQMRGMLVHESSLSPIQRKRAPHTHPSDGKSHLQASEIGCVCGRGRKRRSLVLERVHLKWPQVHYCGAFKANSSVEPASKSNPRTAHCTKVVYVGQVRGMLVCDNSLSHQHRGGEHHILTPQTTNRICKRVK